jgi:hypothetical protein
MQRFRRLPHVLVALAACAASLVGCGDTGTSMLRTARYVLPEFSDADSAPINPELRYLRVTIGGRVLRLALGYYDPDVRGSIEVWYSSAGEVVKLLNGRLVGVIGAPWEWHRVVLPTALPTWSDIGNSREGVRWERVRDAMPGYRYGIREVLAVRRVSPPFFTRLRDLDANKLLWFEERIDSAQLEEDTLSPARYAVEVRGTEEIVVYGEQCIVRDFCITWQRWPAGS